MIFVDKPKSCLAKTYLDRLSLSLPVISGPHWLKSTSMPTPPFEYVEPIGHRVLVRKDEPKRQTKGGIALPDDAEIPTITGRIVTISAAIENDEDLPLRQYDKVLFHPKNAIPVDFESDNHLFVVPVEDIVAVFRRSDPPTSET